MFDELWSEIQDAPGEIFDIPELNDEDFNWNEYLAADYDYWWNTFLGNIGTLFILNSTMRMRSVPMLPRNVFHQ